MGTDVSEAVNRTRFLGPGGTEVGGGFTSANDPPGSEGLAEEALRRARGIGATGIRWGLEATDPFRWHLATYLTTHPDLVAAGLEPWVFDPRQVASSTDASGDPGKGDRVDAPVIADRLRSGRLPAECSLDERSQPLQRLTRHRRHLVGTLLRGKRVALGYIHPKLSAYRLTRPLADPFGATSQVLLTDHLTPDEIVAAPLEELAGVIAREGRGKVADPEQVAEAVEQAARRSPRLPARMVEPVNLVPSSSLATIRALGAQLGPVDRAIAAELQAVPRQTVDTVPGLGPVFTAGIVAGLGDVRRFEDEEPVARFAGLTWRRHRSGELEGEDRPLTETGNASLRYHLIEGANSVRSLARGPRPYYERKLLEATRHRHRRALVPTARKLVRPVDPLLRSGPLIGPAEAVGLSRVFKILANDTRLRLLHALAKEEELRLTDLAERVQMTPQAVSNQLQRLADRGILASRRAGTSVFYRVADPCVTSLLDLGLCVTETLGAAPNVTGRAGER